MKKLNCNNLEEVTDITSQCNYEDEHAGGGAREWQLVACCQDKGYNELKNKLKKYQAEFKQIPVRRILEAMCECCNEYEPVYRTHSIFDACVRAKLKKII